MLRGKKVLSPQHNLRKISFTYVYCGSSSSGVDESDRHPRSPVKTEPAPQYLVRRLRGSTSPAQRATRSITRSPVRILTSRSPLFLLTSRHPCIHSSIHIHINATRKQKDSRTYLKSGQTNDTALPRAILHAHVQRLRIPPGSDSDA